MSWHTARAEPEAFARAAGGEERLEHPGQLRRAHAVAGVDDLDHHLPRLVARGRDPHDVLVLRVVGDRLGRVEQQVQQHPPQRARIAVHQRHRRDLADQLRAMADLVGREPDRVIDHRADVDGPDVGGVGLREQPQVARDLLDLGQPLARVLEQLDAVRVLGRLARLGELEAGEPPDAEPDRGQRVVELVRDATGQRPEHREALGLGDAGAPGVLGLDRARARRDVAQHADHAGDAAPAVQRRLVAALELVGAPREPTGVGRAGQRAPTRRAQLGHVGPRLGGRQPDDVVTPRGQREGQPAIVPADRGDDAALIEREQHQGIGLERCRGLRHGHRVMHGPRRAAP